MNRVQSTFVFPKIPIVDDAGGYDNLFIEVAIEAVVQLIKITQTRLSINYHKKKYVFL